MVELGATVEIVNDNNLQPSGTAMRPQTAAKKLGIYLPAAPSEFQERAITHAELRDLHTNPPSGSLSYAAPARTLVRLLRKNWEFQ